MKKTTQFLFLVIAFATTLLVACGGENDSIEGETGSGDQNGAEAANNSSSGTLLISGSSAMQPLVMAAADQFMDEHPNADVQVQAGGSGTGLTQVADGAVEIGNSDIFAEEKEEIPADTLVDHRIAVVGMGPAVHPEVGIENLTKEELIRVFTGEVTNWSELGGNDMEIVLVNRPDSSGTRATFVDFGLDGAEPAEGITEDSSNTVKQIIAETEGAIGYLAFSYYTDDTVLPVTLDGVEQNAENVQTGDFPIWAYMHSYTLGEAEGLTKEFLDFLMSEEIQTQTVPEIGYISAADMQVERDAEGNETEVK